MSQGVSQKEICIFLKNKVSCCCCFHKYSVIFLSRLSNLLMTGNAVMWLFFKNYWLYDALLILNGVISSKICHVRYFWLFPKLFGYLVVR